ALWQELYTEYRKAAERATRQGDYRRAAYVYGVLLCDYGQAANALFQGKLYHDAAVLYLQKLADLLMAARAFEAAGGFDEAVRLYQQRRYHVLAGDLLRRMGEDAAALAEYQLAAEELLGRDDHLGAGRLLLEKTGRTDLALGCFRAGWERRPLGSAVPC